MIGLIFFDSTDASQNHIPNVRQAILRLFERFAKCRQIQIPYYLFHIIEQRKILILIFNCFLNINT